MMFEREKMRIRRRRRNNAIIILVSLIAIAIFWSTGEHNQLGLSRSALLGGNDTVDASEELSESAIVDVVGEQEGFDPRPIIEHFQSSDQPISKRKVVVQEWRTSHGAKVLFMPTSGLPMVDIRVIFDAGSAREGDARGASGFVAELLGKGSQQFSESEIVQGFGEVGARFRASAHRDMGVVHLRSLSESAYLEPSIGLFLEILTRPTFPERQMERLRSLTKTGLIKRKELPEAQATELFMKAIYKDHPYGRVLTIEDVEALSLGEVEAFYQKYYTAQNVSIAIVGDITREAAESFVDQLTNKLATGERPSSLPDPPVLEESILIEHQFPSTQAHVKIGRWLIDRKDPDFEALYMANQILGGGGFSSVLSEEVRQRNGLAYSVGSSFSGMNSKGPFFIGFQTKASNYNLTVDVANQALVDMVAKGVDEKRFDRLKKYVVGSFPLTTASNSSIVGYLGAMAFYDLPADYLDRFLKKLAEMDLQTINATVKKYWKDKPMVTVIVGDIAASSARVDQNRASDDL